MLGSIRTEERDCVATCESQSTIVRCRGSGTRTVQGLAEGSRRESPTDCDGSGAVSVVQSGAKAWDRVSCLGSRGCRWKSSAGSRLRRRAEDTWAAILGNGHKRQCVAAVIHARGGMAWRSGSRDSVIDLTCTIEPCQMQLQPWHRIFSIMLMLDDHLPAPYLTSVVDGSARVPL